MDNKTNIDNIVKERYDIWVNNASEFTNEPYDIINHILLSLYERDFDIERINYIDNYINSAAKIAAWSDNSSYRRLNEMHKFKNSKDIDDIDIPDIENEEYTLPSSTEIIEELRESDFSWCEQEIFLRKILEDKTFREIGEDFNLKLSQVYYTYNKIKKFLFNKFEKKLY